MNASFYNGVGGVKTAQLGVDVWGDNIANMNTTGYKSQKVDFHTLFSTANMNHWSGSTLGGTSPVVANDIGVGAFGATTSMDLSQGSIQPTDNPFDLSVQGKGFFEVLGENGEKYFSRTGSFIRDTDGTLVNANGEKLLGIDAKTLTSSPATSPAIPTNKIDITANIKDDLKVDKKKPALLNSDFGVLFNEKGDSLELKECQNLVFGFGNIKYEDKFLKNETIIKDDKIDGKAVNINFIINGKQIKVELPDGTKKKEIILAVEKELAKNNIKFETLKDGSGSAIGVTIKDSNKLYLHNNQGDFFTTTNGKLLTFMKVVQHDGEFSTIDEFVNNMQEITKKSYPYGVDIEYNNGKFIITNKSKTEIKANILTTDKSNKLLIENFGDLTKSIKPTESTSSKIFNNTKSVITGDIIDKNGNKNTLKIEMSKIEHKQPYDVWNALISEIDTNGTIISKSEKEFTFVKNTLMNPTEIIMNNSEDTFIKLNLNSSNSATKAFSALVARCGVF